MVFATYVAILLSKTIVGIYQQDLNKVLGIDFVFMLIL